MTEDELKAVAVSPWVNKGPTAALLADIERLRGLIKDAEGADGRFETCQRPWCHASGDDMEPHKADCPAFTPEGVVK